MKIRAAVLEEFGRPLVVQDVELAEPKAGEVLVRVEACGVCHTDLYTASGADPTGYSPCVLGHEGAGVVEAIGEGVTSLQPGDRVITLFAPECGVCLHCRSTRTNRCLAIRDQQGLGHLPDGTTRLSRGGEDLRHFMGTSTFAEATVMPEIALAKVGPDVPPEGASIFACGLSTDSAPRCTPRRSRPARRAPSSAAGSWASARSPAAGCRAPSGSSRSTSPRNGSRWRVTMARPTRCSPPRTSPRCCAIRRWASAATTPSRRLASWA